MPVFQVHLPEQQFSGERKRALARALPEALHEALGIPAADQFVALTTHGPDELFLDPGYMGMQRSERAIIITVLFTAERPLADKRKLVAVICRNAADALGIEPDDVFIALMPVPKENFSFGRGELQLASESN
ncbi:phenylpyruvate tautomerase PptA (4-oxalocrotonate tautomerase family) [Leucobacter exalbidus]|uniref:Phenylpyruvate tautomerase PptA (4-oxalocrotonate tautomerase family) n=1 Tax=Leucobacter exalbidus TaxID=662960 RepID=A0A940T2B6_9MICO|nr:tautomerase family protein [Leucobacter exalbidus]MBP1324872.1 phenylpyruvate tautomerase PptA (4-oxalocrotonate tautomerase family) [Leucobacter exalbidus]